MTYQQMATGGRCCSGCSPGFGLSSRESFFAGIELLQTQPPRRLRGAFCGSLPTCLLCTPHFVDRNVEGPHLDKTGGSRRAGRLSPLLRLHLLSPKRYRYLAAHDPRAGMFVAPYGERWRGSVLSRLVGAGPKGRTLFTASPFCGFSQPLPCHQISLFGVFLSRPHLLPLGGQSTPEFTPNTYVWGSCYCLRNTNT